MCLAPSLCFSDSGPVRRPLGLRLGRFVVSDASKVEVVDSAGDEADNGEGIEAQEMCDTALW